MEKRYHHSDEREEIKQKVISIYQDLKTFLKSDEYTEDLKNELQQSYPDYLEVLEKRIGDMEKSDHGIVIAGETSAGKSTLINKILEKKIFKDKILESSSTICKIRNSERIKLIAELESGETEETDLTNKCDLTTKKGMKALRNTIKTLTDMSSSTKSIHYRSVDIGFPIPILMGNVILVDTPGIGGSGKVTEKLMEYLPYAVSFIFVINVANAGGMQSDRLPEILKSISMLQMDNEMPCFKPENVIFITNKWDVLDVSNTDEDSSDEDSSDEDEKHKVWEDIKSKIKQRWPSVREEHIFKMNLKDVSPENDNPSTTQFNKFRGVLESSIRKAENIRVVQHLKFLQEILMNLSQGINARLDLGKKTEEEQMALTKKHRDKIKFCFTECREVRDKLQKRIKEVIGDKAQKCYDYMSTDIGREAILNPEGRAPIMEIDWLRHNFAEIINARVIIYVESELKSSDVVQMFETVKNEIALFHEKVSSDLSEMEKEWIDVEAHKVKCPVNTDIDDTDISLASVAGVVVATSPVWVPALAAGIAFGIAFAGLGIVLGPVAFPTLKFLGRDTRKKKIIDKEYNTCHDKIKSIISDAFESNYGCVINKLIDKVTEDMLPKRINALHKMIQQLLTSRAKILQNQKSLRNLSMKVKAMDESSSELSICLIRQKGMS